jgi:hypothetical protein
MTDLPSRTLTVKTYDEFRDTLPFSGVFEMTDCSVEIWCPELAEVEEVSRMVALIESMVHVTDVRVGSSIEDFASEDYRVVISEQPDRLAKKRSSR